MEKAMGKINILFAEGQCFFVIKLRWSEVLYRVNRYQLNCA